MGPELLVCFGFILWALTTVMGTVTYRIGFNDGAKWDRADALAEFKERTGI